MATLTRDTILGRALDMVGSPTLNNNDRPLGTITANALSASWLQDALNLFADEFPWAQIINTVNITIPTSASLAVSSVASDFILDVRNGIYMLNSANPTVASNRLTRTSYQKMLDRQVVIATVGPPSRYVIVGGNIKFWKIPDQAYSAVLAYYARPATLISSTIPYFPTDLPLIEYVRYRALEWIREEKPGAALTYALSQIADLRKSGLGMEPEDDTIPFDRDQFMPMIDSSTVAWLGPFSNQ
jgi:hypothetical protein